MYLIGRFFRNLRVRRPRGEGQLSHIRERGRGPTSGCGRLAPSAASDPRLVTQTFDSLWVVRESIPGIAACLDDGFAVWPDLEG